MKWKIEVRYKPNMRDSVGQDIIEDISNLGINGVDSVRTAKIYWIEGEFQAHEINRIGSELLTDSVTQDYNRQRVDNGPEITTSEVGVWIVEVRFKPGVTDAVGESVIKGIRDLGSSRASSAQTGQKYWISGDLEREAIETISQSLLANEVIQTFTIL